VVRVGVARITVFEREDFGTISSRLIPKEWLDVPNIPAASGTGGNVVPQSYHCHCHYHSPAKLPLAGGGPASNTTIFQLWEYICEEQGLCP
jgi:hypothetical protein